MRGTSEREIFWACFFVYSILYLLRCILHNIIYKMPVGVQRKEQSVGIIVGAFAPNIIYNIIQGLCKIVQ